MAPAIAIRMSEMSAVCVSICNILYDTPEGNYTAPCCIFQRQRGIGTTCRAPITSDAGKCSIHNCCRDTVWRTGSACMPGHTGESRHPSCSGTCFFAVSDHCDAKVTP